MSSNNPEAATSPSTSNDPHQHYDGRGWGDEEEEKQEEEYEDDDEDDDDDRLVSIAVTPRHHVGVDVVGDRGDIGGGCDLGDDDDGGVGELGLDDEVGDVKSGGGDGDVKRDVVGKGGGVDFNDKDELLFGRKDEIEVREFEEYLEVEGMFVGFPVLIPRDYDLPTRWAEDVVVLMHNAVRREVSDLYEIMSAISMRYRLLTYKDIWALRQWWYLFLHFWEICNRADKEILFPLVSRSFEVSGRMMQFRKKFRYLGEVLDWLNFKLEEITAYVQALGKLPSGKVMALLFKAVKEFTPKMLKYFDSREREYPLLLKVSHEAMIKIETELKILALFKASKYSEESIVFLVRWMTNRHQKARWLNARLGWRERPMFSQYMQKFHARHGAVIERFKMLKNRRAPKG